MLTDDELKEIKKRHSHAWDDGFEDIPLLIDEIEQKDLKIVLMKQSLRKYAEKVESLNAVIETLTDKLTTAGTIVDVKQAEIERLRVALAEYADRNSWTVGTVTRDGTGYCNLWVLDVAGYTRAENALEGGE